MEIQKCSHCNQLHEPDDMEKIDGKYHCYNCYTHCVECNRAIAEGTENNLCKRCSDKKSE